MDRLVAFALIKTEGLDDTSRARIQREAQAMVRLGSNPHIVTAPDFGQEPQVANGATDLLSELYREVGAHGRSAVGMGSLPNGACIEIEMIMEVEDLLDHAKDFLPTKRRKIGSAFGEGSDSTLTGNPRVLQDPLRHDKARMTIRNLKTLSAQEILAFLGRSACAPPAPVHVVVAGYLKRRLNEEDKT